MKQGKRLWSYISDYKLQSIFFRNFLLALALIIIPLMVILSTAMAGNRRIAEQEMISLAKSNLTNTRYLLDSVFQDVYYIAGSLSLDNEVRQFIYSDLDNQMDRDRIYRTLVDQINQLIARNKPVSSIYIFSEQHNEVLTMTGGVNLAQFKDVNWMNQYDQCIHGQPLLFPRNVFEFTSNTYDERPNALTILKPSIRLDTEQPAGAIVINIAFEKLQQKVLGEQAKDSLHIVQEDGTVIFSSDRREILLNSSELQSIPPLSAFQPDGQSSGISHAFTDDHLVVSLFSSSYDLIYILSLPLTRFDAQGRRLRTISITLILLSVVITFISSLILSWNSYLPIQRLLSVLEDSGSRLAGTADQNEIKFIANSIIRNLNANTSLKTELKSQLKILDHTRAAALQAQINPHFLFNTLEAIRWSAVSLSGKENTVSTMIADLASLLRLSLETDENTIPLAAEMRHADLYIRILKARYPRKLDVLWNVDIRARQSAVLKLCLQPVIENAYYHGIKPLRTSGNIAVTATVGSSGTAEDTSLSQNALTITIRDNGQGMPADKLKAIQEEIRSNTTLKEDHIGIINVHQRIRLVFGTPYGLTIDSKQHEGTVVTLTFPVNT